MGKVQISTAGVGDVPLVAVQSWKLAHSDSMSCERYLAIGHRRIEFWRKKRSRGLTSNSSHFKNN